MVSNLVGKKFGQLLPTWANWVKIWSFRVPCELICSASVDWTAFKTGPKQAPKNSKSNLKTRKRMLIWPPHPRAPKQISPRPGKNENCPNRELSARHIFISYPWMVARSFYWVTGQLKGHSHVLGLHGVETGGRPLWGFSGAEPASRKTQMLFSACLLHLCRAKVMRLLVTYLSL